ncbi:MAG: amidohydrolase family protein [Sandaracinaceae bacterium]|nr:amidohydrolase family protein [Sandaracinaceae bacterium]MDW8245833.1 amidohydrolase family protein [Sandaracinaceae bacterium]
MKTKAGLIVGVGVGILLLVGLVMLLRLEGPIDPSEPPHLGRFAEIPRIDVHVHVAFEQAERAVRLFRKYGGVRIALNASGGHPHGGGLEESAEIAKRTKGALLPYCLLDFSAVEDPDWLEYVDRTLKACVELGAVGLKIHKGLGLGIVLSDGSLLRVDDPRLDPAFELAGKLGLPILIHSGDPKAFFQPPTPDNERYEELLAHPGWSFYGPRPDGYGNWPSWEEVFEQYENRVARHPNTTFVGAHFGNAPEEPERVARMLERYPNLVIETAARVPEIGRHDPQKIRDIFIRFADRIMFGTDFQIGRDGSLVLGSSGKNPDPPSRVPFFYESHFRYFEREDRNFPHPTPIQGKWTINGIGLPREVLEKFYYTNAMRVFRLPHPLSVGEDGEEKK